MSGDCHSLFGLASDLWSSLIVFHIRIRSWGENRRLAYISVYFGIRMWLEKNKKRERSAWRCGIYCQGIWSVRMIIMGNAHNITMEIDGMAVDIPCTEASSWRSKSSITSLYHSSSNLKHMQSYIDIHISRSIFNDVITYNISNHKLNLFSIYRVKPKKLLYSDQNDVMMACSNLASWRFALKVYLNVVTFHCKTWDEGNQTGF